MTTYSAVADNEVAAEAAIDEDLMTKLRNNPLAIQEGDDSAPRIANKALVRPTAATTTTLVVQQTDVSGASVENIFFMWCPVKGSYRLDFTFTINSGNPTLTLQVEGSTDTQWTTSGSKSATVTIAGAGGGDFRLFMDSAADVTISDLTVKANAGVVCGPAIFGAY